MDGGSLDRLDGRAFSTRAVFSANVKIKEPECQSGPSNTLDSDARAGMLSHLLPLGAGS